MRQKCVCIYMCVYIYIYMAEFLHCSPETITTLLIDYTPIQNKKLNVWRKKKKKRQVVCYFREYANPGRTSPSPS